ncbi:alpha/beta fold hydrolase [Rufibacter psychrotolerans]|uniref:alpha/beta fold hydrolase n=1 Tax=Rufibacter psychrotolerans TaxID=2812556 RepID=UPI001966F95C|nr:alpha/beta hydrolase [Rufibacter sp. SYSU D00308]
MKHVGRLLLILLLFSCGQPPQSSQAPTAKGQLEDGERFYSINGVRHWVNIKGSSKQTTPLVVVHGGPGGNNYTFERTVGPLLEKFATVVYYEQRGCGRSDAPQDPEDYLLQTLISDLEGLRQALGAPRLVLLGYSFGAELSLRYAARHPDKVEKLILSAPAELSPSNMLVQIQGFHAVGDSVLRTKIEKIIKDTTALEQKYAQVWNLSSAAVVDKFLFLDTANARRNRELWKESKLTNTGLMAKVYLRHNKADLIRTAAGVTTPTLLISGVYDKNGGLHTGLALRQVLSHNTLKLYQNSAHFPDLEEPARFAADVQAFLKGK